MPLLASLGRGAVAGAVGGLLTGGFGYLLAEPVMDRAVRLETARSSGPDGMPAHAEVFGRHTQHLGFLLAALATGIAIGVIFGVVSAVVARDAGPPNRDAATPAHDPGALARLWVTPLRLAAAGWFALFLVPFLRYPANPPGVGDPATLSLRTSGYLAALAIGLVGVLTAALVARDLRRRAVSVPAGQLAVAAVLLATIAVSFVLPADPDALDVPAALLWEFRVLAFASTTLLWAGLGVSFGLLQLRARSRSAASAPELQPAG